ncbi:MAG: hypothetical protein HQ578_05910 [Chloroflexi bacterium]|nr:hypothetical protein [Chloroflexota bacterium]
MLEVEALENAHKKRRELTGKEDFEFEIGVIIEVSDRILDRIDETPEFDGFIWDCFTRHCLCDW